MKKLLVLLTILLPIQTTSPMFEKHPELFTFITERLWKATQVTGAIGGTLWLFTKLWQLRPARRSAGEKDPVTQLQKVALALGQRVDNLEAKLQDLDNIGDDRDGREIRKREASEVANKLLEGVKYVVKRIDKYQGLEVSDSEDELEQDEKMLEDESSAHPGTVKKTTKQKVQELERWAALVPDLIIAKQEGRLEIAAQQLKQSQEQALEKRIQELEERIEGLSVFPHFASPVDFDSQERIEEGISLAARIEKIEQFLENPDSADRVGALLLSEGSEVNDVQEQFAGFLGLLRKVRQLEGKVSLLMDESRNESDESSEGWDKPEEQGDQEKLETIEQKLKNILQRIGTSSKEEHSLEAKFNTLLESQKIVSSGLLQERQLGGQSRTLVEQVAERVNKLEQHKKTKEPGKIEQIESSLKIVLEKLSEVSQLTGADLAEKFGEKVMGIDEKVMGIDELVVLLQRRVGEMEQWYCHVIGVQENLALPELAQPADVDPDPANKWDDNNL